tara:strand:+ start:794 stop:1195 length:402 start_codon:yes stop_codon:yes gene_type:complete
MKKIILLIYFLSIFSYSNAFAEKIIFPCTYISGKHYETFTLDMEKKLVITGDKYFPFVKGSTDEIVYFTSFIENGPFHYDGMLFTLFLKDEGAWLTVREKIGKVEFLRASGKKNILELFKDYETSFAFICGEE